MSCHNCRICYTNIARLGGNMNQSPNANSIHLSGQDYRKRHAIDQLVLVSSITHGFDEECVRPRGANCDAQTRQCCMTH
jgi:hypothetical protein